MSILKFVAAIGLTGLSLASCVDSASYGDGGYAYGSGVYIGGYDGGYDRYYGGYDNPYRYRRYDRYPGRDWDNRNDYRRGNDYRQGNNNWRGNNDRPGQGGNSGAGRPSGPRPDRPSNPGPARNYPIGPYSPNSCGGALDCTGISTRGSNR